MGRSCHEGDPWLTRRAYDMRASFITLALDNDADPHVIEIRVIHTSKALAFDGSTVTVTLRHELAQVPRVQVQPAARLALGAAHEVRDQGRRREQEGAERHPAERARGRAAGEVG